MSNRQVGPIAKELIEAKARIADPANWCQGELKRDDRMCALGAIGATLHEGGGYTTPDCLARLAGSDRALDMGFGESGDHVVVLRLNDELGHAAVMRVFDHAIEQALKEGV